MSCVTTASSPGGTAGDISHRRPACAELRLPVGTAVSLVLALFPAAGCSADRPPAPVGDLITSVDTIEGVVHVTNAGTPPEWRLEPAVTIGPPSSAVGVGGPEEFGRVSSVSLGPGEEVYVGDAQYAEVRVFGVDGEHRRTFGRHGEGPGEFSDIHSVAWVGDRLLVLDLIGGRINEFSPDGEALGQRRAPGFWGGPDGAGFFHTGHDEVYSVALVPDAGGIDLVYVGQNVEGETGDTLYPPEPPRDEGIRCEYNNGWSSHFEIIYSPRLISHPGFGGTIYQATTDAYRIAVTRGADTLRIIERALPPEEITDDEWAAATERFYNFLDETPRASCTPRRPVRPAVKPFVDEIIIAPDGRLWVEIMRTAGNRWEVFDREGRLLASVPLRDWKQGSVPAFGSGHMVTIRRDSLDLDHVDVWRIDRGDS